MRKCNAITFRDVVLTVVLEVYRRQGRKKKTKRKEGRKERKRRRNKEKLEETKGENEVRRNERTNQRKQGKTLRKRKAFKKKTNLTRTTCPPQPTVYKPTPIWRRDVRKPGPLTSPLPHAPPPHTPNSWDTPVHLKHPPHHTLGTHLNY